MQSIDTYIGKIHSKYFLLIGMCIQNSLEIIGSESWIQSSYLLVLKDLTFSKLLNFF